MSRTIPSRHLKQFSTQIHQSRIASSFKPGPFRGALLSKEAPSQDEPAKPPAPVHHEYSVAQLSRSTRKSTSEACLHFPNSELIKQHLEELLFPLTFSEQMACRIVSAKNLLKSQAALDELLRQHPGGGPGFARLGEHNTKLSFIGRRAMHFALANFLLHAPRAPGHPPQPTRRASSEILDDALLTKFVLGQYVGHQWELEKIMRWRELDAPPGDEKQLKSIHGTGLWKTRGHVVEAIVGAVMTEHGTRLSVAVFNSLVLPHLSFRLDPALLPAIKALQAHDQKLETPHAGRVDWSSLDISPFIDPALLPSSSSSSSSSASSSSLSKPPVAAVG